MDVLWDELTAEDWAEALSRAPHCALQQDWSYGEAIREQGHEVRRAVLLRGGRIAAVAQLAQRRIAGPLRMALLMRGPVWIEQADPLAERGYIDQLRSKMAGAVLMWTPDSAAAEDRPAATRCGHHRVLTGYSTVMLDLSRGPRTLFAAAHGKWRNLVRAGMRAPLEVVTSPGRRMCEWLISANESYRRQVGYAGPTPDFVRTYGNNAGPANRHVLIATEGQQPVAGIMLHVHGRSATYYVGCTSPRGRQLRAHHLLLWRGIELMCDLGARVLDLGGIDTQAAPGIARFKLGTGGRPVTLPGTYLVPPRFASPASKARGPRFPTALATNGSMVGRT